MDAHADTLRDLAAGRRRFGEPSPAGHVDLPRLREGGVDVQFFSVFVEPAYKPERALSRCLHLIEVFHREVLGHEGVRPVRWRGEAMAAAAAGELGAALALEGAEPIGTDLALVGLLRRLGVICLGLCWNERNAFADGVGQARSGGGLTELGVELVREAQRLGMIVDLAHVSEAGFWDVLAIAEKPVLVSHANARALCDHRRNLTDAQLRALGAAGGVVGISFCPEFVHPDRATLERVADHVVHAALVAGATGVGLGSDFDGIEAVPEGLEDVSRLPRLTEELLRRGFTEDELAGILGGNLLRLLAVGEKTGGPPARRGEE